MRRLGGRQMFDVFYKEQRSQMELKQNKLGVKVENLLKKKKKE